MLNKLILAMLLMSPAAFAAGNETERHDCSIYNNNPRACVQDPSCVWSDHWQICAEDGNPGGGGRACSAYDFDPYTCNQQPYCQYDQWSRRCEDYNGPGPGPRSCYDYSNNPRLCDRTPGCYYDRRSYQCVDDNGPGPGDDYWTCTAVDSGWEEHSGGHTVSGRGYQNVQWEAIQTCRQYHGDCVIQSCRQY